MGYKVKSIQKEVIDDEFAGQVFKHTEKRFIIIDEETDEILDDAQGYGYKTPQNAWKAWNYMHRSPEKIQREKDIENWLYKHKDFVREYNDLCFYSLKDHVDVTQKDVKNLLETLGLVDGCPFSVKELIGGLGRFKG